MYMDEALFHRNEGRLPQATAGIEKSVAVIKKLVAARPNVKSYRFDLAEKYIHLGTFLIDQNEIESARDVTADAVAILEPLVFSDENAFAVCNLGQAYAQLGQVTLTLGDLAAAMEWTDKDVQLMDAVPP